VNTARNNLKEGGRSQLWSIIS